MFKRTMAVTISALAVLGINISSAHAVTHPGITCIAHRGGHTSHTEESSFNYAAAIAADIPEVEGDVRFTSTGYPYLLHSSKLGLFGHPDVSLASVSAGVATGPDYVSATGDKLLSLFALREMLVDSLATRVQLELKTVLNEDDWTMLASRLNPIRSRTTITSFNKATVQAAQVHGYRTGLLSSTFSTTTEAPTFIVNFSALDADETDRHKLVGVGTQTFTLDTEVQWDAAASAGVTGIITDDPEGCIDWTLGI